MAARTPSMAGWFKRTGLDAIGRGGILHAQARGRQALERAGLRVQNADVRSVEFVGRAQQKIGIQGAHVQGKVRRVVHGVDHQERSHLARQAPREERGR